MKQPSLIKKWGTLVVIFLIINLSFVSALELSNVQATQVTQTSAVIQWTTDEPADSFVSYGTNKSNLQKTGDADAVTEHSLALSDLQMSTAYVYAVESNNAVNNNSGNLFSFTTPGPDTTAPELVVELPATAGSSSIDIAGTAEPGAEITLQVNGIPMGKTFALQAKAKPATEEVVIEETAIEETATEETASPELAKFEFLNVLLQQNIANKIIIEASDAFGNKKSFEGEIFCDVSKPQLKLGNFSKMLDKTSLPLIGTFSENVSYEIFVNNKSVSKGEGLELKETITLEEGENVLKILFTDAVGHTNVEERTISADTRAPTLKVEIEKGYEYFEGRAESDINGETEAGAKAYLYVYKQMGGEFHPDFSRDARATSVADEKGEFTFKEVDFAQLITDISFKDVGPKEVPSSLLDLSMYPIEESINQQYSTYNIYIIVEDKSGKNAYWQGKVTVQTCYSGLDFSVESISQFQGPLRLVPKLMDDGREQIQAAFDIKYIGDAFPATSLAAEDEDFNKGFKINTVQFQKACTQNMKKSDDKFGLGCKVMPNGYKSIPNGDKTKIYVTWNLNSAGEWSKGEEGYWNQFKKSQIVFPIKVSITYQERESSSQGMDQWSAPKTETMCYDLGYFVDIPIDSKDMIPDFLANEGVQSLNWTIAQISAAEEYVKTAYYVTGVMCMGSTTLRMVTRWYRIFMSKVESYFSVIKTVAGAIEYDSNDKPIKMCLSNQGDLYLEEELSAWYDAINDVDKNVSVDDFKSERLRNALSDGKDSQFWKDASLSERCPKTAAAWKAESYLDQAYKWTCDRAFCRTVPAKWTESKKIDDIQKVIIEQSQCAVTGRGVPLMRVENCLERVQANPLNMPAVAEKEIGESSGVCWQGTDGTLYVNVPEKQVSADTQMGIFRLTPVGRILGDLEIAKEPLKVYKPEGSEDFFVGKDAACDTICSNPRKPGYKAVGCKKEEYEGQIIEKDKVLIKLNPGEYTAGYTSDCFVKFELGNPYMEQCVCIGEKSEEVYLNVRTAEPKETWFYHQERVFKESGKRLGTYYPTERYYTGRDLSGAFGANYFPDYLHSGNERESQVNPHSQIIGTFQTLCLSGILKEMRMLNSILIGLRDCLIEAKYTGLHDAGMCKTMFSQHVCGLLYKAIALLNNGCSARNFDEAENTGAFADVEAVVSAGMDGMEQSLQSSINDLRDDYGNARLNEYFKGGAQGAAQSMCMAAFGYEIPIFSKEFLLDAAYAFPMASSVLIYPNYRELSNYNPQKQTAIFNYEIGGSIMPGCRIKSWSVSLKCIGPEDIGNAGVDTSCNGQGCDCLNAQNLGASVEGEREVLIKSDFDLMSGQWFSLPLESPLQYNSNYRYDHVVVKLNLDHSEKGNEEYCFDDEYIKGNSAVYYFPIEDVSPPGEFACRADLTTGRYSCPEISTLFGFGETYLEDPYITCWNKYTQNWVSCDTPNLFSLGDEIKVRAHVNSDGTAKCLGRKVQGILGMETMPTRTIPEGQPGFLPVADSLGLVTEEMFTGYASSSALTLSSMESSSGCTTPSYIPLQGYSAASGNRYEFQYVPSGGDKFQLVVPSAAIPQGLYSKNGDYVIKTGTNENTFTLQEIKGIAFNMDGYQINNVLGNAGMGFGDNVKKCVYVSGAQSYGSGYSSGYGSSYNSDYGSGYNNYLPNEKEIIVTYELLEKDEFSGGCSFANQLVKAASGKARHDVRIKVQKEEFGGLHSYFLAGNYDNVQVLALDILNMKKGDVTNAVAIYYGAAALVMKGGGNINANSLQITNLLNAFFTRDWGGEKLPAYTADVIGTGEYKKIEKYLTEIGTQIGYQKTNGEVTQADE